MDAVKNTGALSSAISNLQRSLQKQSAQIADEAQNIQNGFRAGANEIAASESPEFAETVQELDPQVVREASEQNIASSVVNMKSAEHAYTATLKALQVVNDVERETIDILR